MRALFLAAALAVTGCGTPDSPPPERASRPETFASSPIARPDSELTKYLAWQRDWMLQVNNHWAELQAESQRIASRYSLRGADSIPQDPELLAMLERQRGEMQLLVARAPRGATAQALDATLPGVGRIVTGPTGMTYVPGRDEAVLAAARARHGEEFVRWVLANERTIVATLRGDR